MFPDYNIHSSSLLILAIQGFVFAILLLFRYSKQSNITDLFLGLILLITVWHQSTYTIGFMGWYDTYRNTKVNYFLIDLSLLLAPLIYFYVKSITTPHFRLGKKDFYHFIPIILFVLFKLFIFVYDALQIDFAESQNGYLVRNLEFKYTNLLLDVIIKIQLAAYLFYTTKRFYKYRSRLPNIFSDTYALQLNWVRNFLIIYIALFVYMTCQDLVNLFFADLSWLQEWWYYLFSSIAIIYIGMVGYFTNTSKLNQVKPNHSDVLQEVLYNQSKTEPIKTNKPNDLKENLDRLNLFMQNEKPYLKPDLNLIELANSLSLTRAQLSELINIGMNKNFNNYINELRVNAVKEMLNNGKHKELSLLGIAYDCGFNSKATFNRVFKTHTGISPSAYLKSLNT